MNNLNKKNIVIAISFMIFSLAIMQGLHTKSTNKSDFSAQQLAAGAVYVSQTAEGGTAAAAGVVASVAGAAFGKGVVALTSTAPVSTTTPPGWVLWGVTAVAGL